MNDDTTLPRKVCSHCAAGRHDCCPTRSINEGRCDCQGEEEFAHLPRRTRVCIAGRWGRVEESITTPGGIRLGVWFDDAIPGSGRAYVRSTDLDVEAMVAEVDRQRAAGGTPAGRA